MTYTSATMNKAIHMQYIFLVTLLNFSVDVFVTLEQM
jgi:hypothetical protein